MSKKYDIVAKNGEYTDKSGAVKSRWINVGAIMENDKGLYMIMNRTFNPAGLPNPDNKESCFLSLFEPKGSARPVQADTPSFEVEELDSEVPF